MKCSFPLIIKKRVFFIFKKKIIVPCGNCYYCKKYNQSGLYQFVKNNIYFENVDLSIKDLNYNDYIKKYVK